MGTDYYLSSQVAAGNDSQDRAADDASPPRTAPAARLNAALRSPAVTLTAWVVVAVTAGMLVAWLHLRQFPMLSALDELQHLDALDAATHGRVIRVGDRVGQLAMSTQACRGIDAPLNMPSCHPGRPYDPSIFQEDGFNTADVHPPTYYFLTSVPARMLVTVGLAEDLFEGGRIAGGIWLGLGAVAFWRLTRRLGIDPGGSWTSLILVATTPVVVHASATVNPDATALLASCMVGLAALAWEDGRLSVWVLALAAVFAVSLKATNALGVGAWGLYLLWRAAERRTGPGSQDPTPARSLTGGMAVIGAGAATVLAWTLVRRAIARTGANFQIERFAIEDLTTGDVLAQLLALVTPVVPNYLPVALTGPWSQALTSLLHLALIAACLGPVFSLTRLERVHRIAVAGAVTMLAGGVILTLANLLLISQAVAIPFRYGFSLLPLLGIGLAAATRSRVLRVILGTLAGASALVTAAALLGWPI
jgi:hypothetical protein